MQEKYKVGKYTPTNKLKNKLFKEDYKGSRNS